MIGRLVVLGLSFTGLVAAQTAPPATFCQRLAPQLGMKQNPDEGGAPEWRVNPLGGLGRALFGGSTTASFNLQPLPGESGEEFRKRHEQACAHNKKGVVCPLIGPVRLIVGTAKGNAMADAVAGERAAVEMRGTSIYCRDVS